MANIKKEVLLCISDSDTMLEISKIKHPDLWDEYISLCLEHGTNILSYELNNSEDIKRFIEVLQDIVKIEGSN